MVNGGNHISDRSQRCKNAQPGRAADFSQEPIPVYFLGRTTWLSVFAPLGSVGDVIATVDSLRSTLELSGDDLLDLATGLTKLMAAYDRMGIYNFNMSFYAGSRNDDHARLHLVFSPRIYFNPSIGTPDVASLGRLFGESVCMGFPEDINKVLKTEF